MQSADIHRTRIVSELRHNGALKFSVEVGLLPDLVLDACLQRAHAMGDVHRRADFVGEEAVRCFSSSASGTLIISFIWLLILERSAPRVRRGRSAALSSIKNLGLTRTLRGSR